MLKKLPIIIAVAFTIATVLAIALRTKIPTRDSIYAGCVATGRTQVDCDYYAANYCLKNVCK